MTATPQGGDGGMAGPVAQCHAVLVDFLAAIDHGYARRALPLFTPDARLVARGTQFNGHEQIADFLATRESERRWTAHLIANEAVRRQERDEIETTALLFLHERQHDGRYNLSGVLDTTQTFRHTSEGWLIAQRSTAPLHPPALPPK